ncbi:hypothetical protein TGARI_238970B, partial [Toxoplasma gondii ARI]
RSTPERPAALGSMRPEDAVILVPDEVQTATASETTRNARLAPPRESQGGTGQERLDISLASPSPLGLVNQTARPFFQSPFSPSTQASLPGGLALPPAPSSSPTSAASLFAAVGGRLGAEEEKQGLGESRTKSANSDESVGGSRSSSLQAVTLSVAAGLEVPAGGPGILSPEGRETLSDAQFSALLQELLLRRDALTRQTPFGNPEHTSFSSERGSRGNSAPLLREALERQEGLERQQTLNRQHVQFPGETEWQMWWPEVQSEDVTSRLAEGSSLQLPVRDVTGEKQGEREPGGVYGPSSEREESALYGIPRRKQEAREAAKTRQPGETKLAAETTRRDAEATRQYGQDGVYPLLSLPHITMRGEDRALGGEGEQEGAKNTQRRSDPACARHLDLLQNRGPGKSSLITCCCDEVVPLPEDPPPFPEVSAPPAAAFPPPPPFYPSSSPPPSSFPAPASPLDAQASLAPPFSGSLELPFILGEGVSPSLVCPPGTRFAGVGDEEAERDSTSKRDFVEEKTLRRGQCRPIDGERCTLDSDCGWYEFSMAFCDTTDGRCRSASPHASSCLLHLRTLLRLLLWVAEGDGNLSGEPRASLSAAAASGVCREGHRAELAAFEVREESRREADKKGHTASLPEETSVLSPQVLLAWMPSHRGARKIDGAQESFQNASSFSADTSAPSSGSGPDTANDYVEQLREIRRRFLCCLMEDVKSEQQRGNLLSVLSLWDWRTGGERPSFPDVQRAKDADFAWHMESREAGTSLPSWLFPMFPEGVVACEDSDESRASVDEEAQRDRRPRDHSTASGYTTYVEADLRQDLPSGWDAELSGREEVNKTEERKTPANSVASRGTLEGETAKENTHREEALYSTRDKTEVERPEAPSPSSGSLPHSLPFISSDEASALSSPLSSSSSASPYSSASLEGDSSEPRDAGKAGASEILATRQQGQEIVSRPRLQREERRQSEWLHQGGEQGRKERKVESDADGVGLEGRAKARVRDRENDDSAEEVEAAKRDEAPQKKRERGGEGTHALPMRKDRPPFSSTRLHFSFQASFEQVADERREEATAKLEDLARTTESLNEQGRTGGEQRKRNSSEETARRRGFSFDRASSSVSLDASPSRKKNWKHRQFPSGESSEADERPQEASGSMEEERDRGATDHTKVERERREPDRGEDRESRRSATARDEETERRDKTGSRWRENSGKLPSSLLVAGEAETGNKQDSEASTLEASEERSAFPSTSREGSEENATTNQGLPVKNPTQMEQKNAQEAAELGMETDTGFSSSEGGTVSPFFHAPHGSSSLPVASPVSSPSAKLDFAPASSGSSSHDASSTQSFSPPAGSRPWGISASLQVQRESDEGRRQRPAPADAHGGLEGREERKEEPRDTWRGSARERGEAERHRVQIPFGGVMNEPQMEESGEQEAVESHVFWEGEVIVTLDRGGNGTQLKRMKTRDILSLQSSLLRAASALLPTPPLLEDKFVSPASTQWNSRDADADSEQKGDREEESDVLLAGRQITETSEEYVPAEGEARMSTSQDTDSDVLAEQLEKKLLQFRYFLQSLMDSEDGHSSPLRAAESESLDSWLCETLRSRRARISLLLAPQALVSSPSESSASSASSASSFSPRAVRSAPSAALSFFLSPKLSDPEVEFSDVLLDRFLLLFAGQDEEKELVRDREANAELDRVARGHARETGNEREAEDNGEDQGEEARAEDRVLSHLFESVDSRQPLDRLVSPEPAVSVSSASSAVPPEPPEPTEEARNTNEKKNFYEAFLRIWKEILHRELSDLYGPRVSIDAVGHQAMTLVIHFSVDAESVVAVKRQSMLPRSALLQRSSFFQGVRPHELLLCLESDEKKGEDVSEKGASEEDREKPKEREDDSEAGTLFDKGSRQDSSREGKSNGEGKISEEGIKRGAESSKARRQRCEVDPDKKEETETLHIYVKATA